MRTRQSSVDLFDWTQRIRLLDRKKIMSTSQKGSLFFRLNGTCNIIIIYYAIYGTSECYTMDLMSRNKIAINYG